MCEKMGSSQYTAPIITCSLGLLVTSAFPRHLHVVKLRPGQRQENDVRESNGSFAGSSVALRQSHPITSGYNSSCGLSRLCSKRPELPGGHTAVRGRTQSSP